ncbi:MAG: hypothetical protein ACE5FP_02290 [Gemmatimonadota bacterium]
MITETVTDLPPERVIEEARQFFTDEGALHSATIVEESETHLTLGMFRSRLAISAFRDAAEPNRTRVRVSTLRRNDAVGKFMAFIHTGGNTGGESPS